MKTSYLKISTALLLLFTFSVNAQNTITIDNGPQSTTQYKTIQEAIDAAVDNDIIFVQPSPTSYGSATINKPLTIIGRSHSELNNTSTISSANISASDVTLKGLYTSNINASSGVSGSPITGIKIYECEFGGITLGGYQPATTLNGIEIRGCVFSSITQYPDTEDILVSNNIITSNQTLYSPSTILITSNIFRFTSALTIANQALGETLILFDNMFINNSSSDRNISLNGSGDFNISKCLTYNYGAGNISFIKSASATFQVNNSFENTDPLFNNIDNSISASIAGTSTYNSATRPEDDLTLQAGSSAITDPLSVPRTEMGIFNNGFNFKYLGNPRGLPTLDIVTYDGAVPKDGNINVTIKAKAH